MLINLSLVEAENKETQEGSLWHEDYSELKANEILQPQEKNIEKSKLGCFPRIRVISRDKFYKVIYQYGRTNIYLSNIYFSYCPVSYISSPKTPPFP